MLASISERNRRIVTGILGGALGRSISLIAPFIVMPFILHELGSYLFGVWMTALSITSMALFMDFGIGNGLLTRLSYANGLNDHQMMSGYIISAYVSLSIIASLLLLIIYVLYLLVHANILHFSVGDSQALYIYLVALVIFILGIPVSVIQRVMYAKQQAFLSNMWQIVASILSIVLCFIAVKLKLAPWEIIFCYSFPLILVLGISTVLFFMKNKEIKPKIKNFSNEKSIDLLKIGSKFLMLAILTSVALNIDNILIANQLGSEMVTGYAIPTKLASLLGMIVTIAFLPLWAANGEAIAKKDYKWVKNNTFKMSLAGAVVLALAVIILTFSTDYIIHLWMGIQFVDQIYIVFYAGLLSFFIAVTSPYNMVLNSMGILKPQIYIWGIFLLCTVIIKFLLLQNGYLVFLPLVSAVSYFFIITLPIIYSANSHLRCEKP